MPTSKPFSASSFADSCPIPESDAVTMATGLILSPLIRKICPLDSMPSEWSAQTEDNRYESKSAACPRRPQVRPYTSVPRGPHWHAPAGGQVKTEEAPSMGE